MNRVEKNSIAKPLKKCYICDKSIITPGYSVAETKTKFSNTPLPNKIKDIINELSNDLIVYVSVDDDVCSRCLTIINQLDEYEIQIGILRKKIINSIKEKYQIEVNVDDNNQTKRKLNDTDSCHTFGSNNVNSNSTKKIKSEIYKCNSCRFSTDSKDRIHFHVNTKECEKFKKFNCKICTESFDNESKLSIHFKNHGTKKCAKCLLEFKNLDSMEIHLCNQNSSSVFSDLLTYKCSHCKFQTIEMNDLISHEKIHSKNMYKCITCHNTFKDGDQLKKHTLTHKKSIYECHFCFKSFLNQNTLLEHFKTHNIKTATTAADSSKNVDATPIVVRSQKSIINEKTTTSSSINAKIEFLTCKICQLTFVDANVYELHVKTHKNSSAYMSNSAKNNQMVDDKKNVDDLEMIFEKLHSEYQSEKENKKTAEILNSTKEDKSVSKNESVTTGTSELQQVNDKQEVVDDNLTKEQPEKIYYYKCPDCDDFYENTDILQMHMIEAGHGEGETCEVQMLEIVKTDDGINEQIIDDEDEQQQQHLIVANDENFIQDANGQPLKIIAEDGTEISYIIDDGSSNQIFIDSKGNQLILDPQSLTQLSQEKQSQNVSTNELENNSTVKSKNKTYKPNSDMFVNNLQTKQQNSKNGKKSLGQIENLEKNKNLSPSNNNQNKSEKLVTPTVVPPAVKSTSSAFESGDVEDMISTNILSKNGEKFKIIDNQVIIETVDGVITTSTVELVTQTPTNSTGLSNELILTDSDQQKQLVYLAQDGNIDGEQLIYLSQDGKVLNAQKNNEELQELFETSGEGSGQQIVLIDGQQIFNGSK